LVVYIIRINECKAKQVSNLNETDVRFSQFYERDEKFIFVNLLNAEKQI